MADLLLSEFVSWYQSTADLIDSAQKRGSDIANKVEYMKTILEGSEISSSDVARQHLESVINMTYDNLYSKHYLYDSRISSFISSLQRYVEKKYGDLNTFLFNNGIVVGASFAGISSSTGYSIDSNNIRAEES